MGILNMLFKRPKLKLRLLQASLELLELRVDHLEHLLASATFPDSETTERLGKFVGQQLSIQTNTIKIPGKLIAVHSDNFEICDLNGRLVFIPATKIISVTFDNKQLQH
ncbi:hypothetical protein [Paenibacillus lentus]|uniref:DUF2642 domain-containing protein n=1 Tax=Paenibacillus lentus TaxID=1338368 RepID=A0A3Q8SDB8_9BACL|nr:hypothetical protein [Paenibacillus lentus]AZK48044.1 hypothetical protein EIM92_19275 [Paenibacillus lentus]